MQTFHLLKHKTNVPISSISATTTIRSKVYITLLHRTDSNTQIPIEALVVPKIGGCFPDEFTIKSHLSSEALADPEYHIPGPVDLLLGAGVWASIIRPHIERSPCAPQLVAQLTTLGYVVYGQAQEPCKGIKNYRISIREPEDDCNVEELLLKYWNADDIPITRQLTKEEELVENNFTQSHRRDGSGRFVVTIPRKEQFSPLGNSYSLAKACFLSVERKMERVPMLKSKYREVIDDYRAAGHMVEAPPFYGEDSLAYYLPHHPINYNPEKAKGKFRVVFNASAASINGVSFNDQQLPGPKLQGDLIETFLRFRIFKFAMTADIKQMFRQVKVATSEYNFQRILWRDEPHHPIKQYFITVVSWGMTSAGYNSVRALRQCAIDGQSEYPLGAEIALNDFYFDDMLSGAHSEQDLILKQFEVSQLLLTAGFELAKFCTNSKSLSERVRNTNCDVPLECGLLGMKWLMNDDSRVSTPQSL